MKISVFIFLMLAFVTAIIDVKKGYAIEIKNNSWLTFSPG